MTTSEERAERARFESWYSTHAFNYSRDPIGSRDCGLQWDAWKAARASLATTEGAEAVGEVCGDVNSRAMRWSPLADSFALPIGTKLYTHPPAPSEAVKDAARYRWLRNNPEWLGWEHDFRPDEVEREIDAAIMASTPTQGAPSV